MTELPKDIGGYQHLSPEVRTNADDILVADGVPLDFCGKWAPDSVAEVEAGTGCNVYRKIPCPRQGGERPEVVTDLLPSDPRARKGIPLATGLLDYFPDALIAVAELSRVGNDQHNPGKALHWDRSKSGDEADALMRHMLERETIDSDGVLHAVKVAWRGLALAQKKIESMRTQNVTK